MPHGILVLSSHLFHRFGIVIVVLASLAGCASSPHDAQTYNDVSTDAFYWTPDEVNLTDDQGRNLIHQAVLRNPGQIKTLVEAGANINARDHSGLTPLHLAVARRHEAIESLLVAGADRTIRTSDAVTCMKTRKEARRLPAGLTAEQLAKRCSFGAQNAFKDFDAVLPYWQRAQEKGTETAYQSFHLRFPESLFVIEAMAKISELRHERFTSAQGSCRMALENWFFIEGSCSEEEKLAQGLGVAETLDGSRLEGNFDKGYMIKGKLFTAGQMIYHGLFERGVPHGGGICQYEGALEECRYYNGQRVDTLFKIRQEMAVHMERIASYRPQQVQQSGASRFDYLTNLNSKNKGKRTVAQIQAALDLFNVMARMAFKQRD